jgi:hypothetical protein
MAVVRLQTGPPSGDHADNVGNGCLTNLASGAGRPAFTVAGGSVDARPRPRDIRQPVTVSVTCHRRPVSSVSIRSRVTVSYRSICPSVAPRPDGPPGIVTVSPGRSSHP